MIWAFAGFSVCVTALFCVFFAQFGADQPFFEANRLLIAGVMVALGALLWFVGARKKKKEAKAAVERGETPEDQSGFPIDLFSMQHWAILFVILSVCVVYIQPWKFVRTQQNTVVSSLQRIEKHPPQARKIEPVPAPATNLLAKVHPPAPPKLKLQGLVFRGENPCAFINGKTYYVGDKVEGAELVGVSREFVTMKFDGVSTILALR